MPLEKPYVPLRLFDYQQPAELVTVMRDALLAHKRYYDAGVLHGKICPQAIMRVPDESAVVGVRGILLDLDGSLGSRSAGTPDPKAAPGV
ncbi:hypothetical protein PHLGIDRAFT_117846 [Phlebiopsis gigantea 11061_1 CR5-6]|uniref:Fungal-type protein kinase domain-containing protein n=1 Tax=Phlebiopsis gigantea (strain 11061_1 CR5-6) TaxID=745531 RepID=A0A0C3S8X6_PHLG1|nr:hypothetical protein PHLGIDRAFT_117846 [Phlebiopsis gigantea 11061_1 CR5-6]